MPRNCNQNHLFAQWEQTAFPWYNNCFSYPEAPKQLPAHPQTRVDTQLQAYSFESKWSTEHNISESRVVYEYKQE